MRGRQAGQATVEAVALLPLVAVIAAAMLHVLAAGRAAAAAASAAEAGALAVLQERDPEAAARDALGGWPRASTRVLVRGGRVRVTVRPRTVVPWLGDRLAGRAVADAGRPGPAATAAETRGGDGASGRP